MSLCLPAQAHIGHLKPVSTLGHKVFNRKETCGRTHQLLCTASEAEPIPLDVSLTTFSESRLCPDLTQCCRYQCQTQDSDPTLLIVAVTASTIDKPRSGHHRRCLRVLVFHHQCFSSLPRPIGTTRIWWKSMDAGRQRTEAIEPPSGGGSIRSRMFL